MVEHPHDLMLADYVDGRLDEVGQRKVRSHLGECAACRRDANAMAASDIPQPTLPERSTPHVPAGLVTAFKRAATPPFAAGQLWRVEWDGRAGLVVVAAGPERGGVPAVGAAAADLSRSDEASVVAVPADRSMLGFNLAVHRSVRRLVPGFVFDRMLTELPGIAELLDEPTADLHPLDPAARERAAREAQLEFFAQARWWSTPGPVEDVGSLARKRGVTLTALVKHLGVSVERGLQLMRGAHPPTRNEAEALGALLDVDPTSIDVDISQVDDEVVVALDDPAWRPRVRARARRLGRREADTLREVALQASRPAARRAGPAGQSWDIRQVIATILSGEQP